MKYYKRLTIKDEEYGNYVENKGSELNKPKVAVSFNGKIHGAVIDRLAELEDKIENGTLIVPKFKIGKVVFFIVRNTIHTSIITDIKIHIFRSNHCKIQYRLTSPDGYMNYKNENDLFTTKAEAEQRLKELQNER